MNALLLRPFLYLRVKHASSTLPWMNWGLPLVATVVVVAAGSALTPTVNLFHASGVFDRLLGFIQSLPGFYLAALAAVATFNRPNLDELMPGKPPQASVIYNGRPKLVELTRRRFLSLVFSYLTALSIALTLALIAGLPLVDVSRDALPVAWINPARAALSVGLLFFAAQLIVITLWGLYYLGERMHTPD